MTLSGGLFDLGGILIGTSFLEGNLTNHYHVTKATCLAEVPNTEQKINTIRFHRHKLDPQ
jgi:hypothetical protein